MKPETRFSHILIDEFTYQLDGAMPFQICRIESNLTMQGIPDIYACINGYSIWIEIKVGKGQLTPMQIAWHKRHWSAGGRSFILYCFNTDFVVIAGGAVDVITGINIPLSKHAGAMSYPSMFEVVKGILKQVEEDVSVAVKEVKETD